MKFRLFLILVSGFFFLVSHSALAHGQLFFEFAPDPWNSERLSTVGTGTPQQLFYAFQDSTLIGFDLWLDNSGSPGQATFTLKNEQGTILAAKSATISSMSPQPGGHKFHVDLPSEVSISGGQVYVIEISTNLSGLGLYYTDRFTILEHNLPLTSEYSLGAAKLGDELQPFTFKLALYEPTIDTPDEEIDDDQEEASTSTPILITNARVVNITHNKATVAWSTNVAADSRVNLRTQLDPLYTIQTVTDPTLELEHTVTLTGLTPNVNYFADAYSSYGQGIILGTYTLGFKTAVAPPSPPPPPPPPLDDDEDPPAGQDPPPTDEDEPPTGLNDDVDDTSEINIDSGAGSGSAQISWDIPIGGKPSGGYRIDIFDHNHNLIRQLTVPDGANFADINELQSGTYHIIIYGDDGEVYQKIAPIKTFTLHPGSGAFTIKVIGVSILWLAVIASYLWWKFKRKQGILPAEDQAV